MLVESSIPSLAFHPIPLATVDLHLFVRLVHVLAVAVLVGGAVMTWIALTRDSDRPGSRVRDSLALAESYEWLFWGAVGLIVMTGVGNLGAFAPNVPGPGTSWGGTFALKLLVVLGLLAFSAGRTVLLRLVAARVDERAATQPLGRAYAITAVALAAALALAEVLAHG